MGIFAKLVERRDQTTLLSDPAGWLWEAFGIVPTDSGISVSPKTALQYTAVYACVNVLAQTIAQVPFDVYRRKNKGKELAEDRTEHWLLHTEPNGAMTSYSMRAASMANALLYGSMYLEIVRDGAARTKAFRILPAIDVSAYESLDKDRLIYNVTRRDGTIDTLDGSDVIHVPCLSLDGVGGLSPMAQHRQAVGLGLAAEAAGSSFFGNGSRPSGFLTTDKALRPGEREEIERKWFRKFGGSKNSGKVPVLSGGLKWTQLSIPPADAQYIETRNFQAAEIARIYRVPAVLIGLADKTSTYASAEAFFQSFVQHTILPWAVAFEQEFDRKLFPNSTDYYCKLDLKGLLRGDAKARGMFYKDLFSTASIKPDEIRDYEDLDPLPDGMGDRAWVQQGFMPLDKADEILAKQGSQPATPQKQPNDNQPNRAAHVAWLGDVFDRVRKWERFDAKRAAEQMMPVFRSLRPEYTRMHDFALDIAENQQGANAELVITRFLQVSN